MTKQTEILNAIYQAIDELNLTLAPEKQVPKDPSTLLGGSDGHLSSLGVVNLVVEAEIQIEEAFGVMINLADQQVAEAAQNPFKSVQSLVDYVEVKLREAQDAGVTED